MKLPSDGGTNNWHTTAAGPWVLAATILGSSMASIDSTVVNVALPALQANLGATLLDVQWVVESYALLLSALILVGGSLGDLFGRRRMFLFGALVFASASCVCGFAPNIRDLIIARAVQGLGAAFLVPGSLSIISSYFGEQERGRAIGTWSGVTAIATAAGPILGGWLIEHASWRWVFYINVPIAAAVMAIALWRVPESKAAALRAVDWTGALLVTIGLGGVTYGLIESGSLGWSEPTVWGSVVVGCLCLTAFLLLEARSVAPMIPLELFHSSDFTGANLLTLCLYAALGVFIFLYPLNLIQIHHYSATAAGAAALPLILLMFLLSRWSGGLVSRFGARRPLMIGPVIAAAGFVLFAIPSVGGSYWTTFFPAFMVLGLGMATSVAPLTTVVMSSVDRSRSGTASGINNAVARGAGLFAIAILGIVMVTTFRNRLNQGLAKIGLPTEVLQVLRSNEIRLGAMTVPSGLAPDAATQIAAAIDAAFVFGFRLIMLICASLALTSAAFAWAKIGRRSRYLPAAAVEAK